MSKTKFVKVCLNKGGPPSKLNYILSIDSAKYREGKMKSTQ